MSSVPTAATLTTNSVKSQNEVEQTSTLQDQIQQVPTVQPNEGTSQTNKKNFVTGTDEVIDRNSETHEVNPQERVELPNNINEAVESHRNTKERFYKPYPAEEIAKVAEERNSRKLQKQQNAESPVSETVEAVADTSTNTQTPPPSETKTTVIDAIPSDQHQKLLTEKNIEEVDEKAEPSNMTSSDSPNNEQIISNEITKQPPNPITNSKFIHDNLPLDSADEVTPIASPTEKVLDTPLNSVDGNGNTRNHNNLSNGPIQTDDSYSSEPFDYQPQFPLPGSSSRTQQKLLLQRQHYFTDDENYVIHPRNQLRLTKVIDRINREHAAILIYRDPMIESLQRAFTRYAQDHPEVLDDDFGAGYEDSKEWGMIPDQKRNLDQIVANANSIVETLTAESKIIHINSK
ncbi:8860_t:CDS:1 [Acaulospora morrowiae]|uniref:8860_t:CDS:1 n=1 Tax=Acaulospora morrowiae TaxID=94023 RepID=A0A9N9AH40_9GLOM|nr:8860_t:CDS:1 [Acaulospora morrowiae]